MALPCGGGATSPGFDAGARPGCSTSSPGPWIPVVQHLLLAGRRRHQLPAGHPHLVPQHAGHGGQLADRQARQGLLHPVPAVGNGHVGRVHVAGLLPVLRVLGSDAAADVLSDRRLGRAAARICGHQVLPLHAGRQRADADRPADALLRQRPAASSRTSSSVAACIVHAGVGRRRRRRAVDLPARAHLQHPGPDGHGPARPTRPSTRRCSGASRSSGGRSCCCSSASSSSCRRCRCTPGCPTPTSRPPRRSR